MSKVCELCLKSYQKANHVSRLIGNRVSGRSIKRQQPNLKTKRIIVEGQTQRYKLCSSCLKKAKKESIAKVKGIIKLS